MVVARNSGAALAAPVLRLTTAVFIFHVPTTLTLFARQAGRDLFVIRNAGCLSANSGDFLRSPSPLVKIS